MEYPCNHRYSPSGPLNPQTTSLPISNSMPIGMCYVPWQKWGTIYEPYKALCRGTMFPDLDKPFLGGGR